MLKSHHSQLLNDASHVLIRCKIFDMIRSCGGRRPAGELSERCGAPGRSTSRRQPTVRAPTFTRPYLDEYRSDDDVGGVVGKPRLSAFQRRRSQPLTMRLARDMDQNRRHPSSRLICMVGRSGGMTPYGRFYSNLCPSGTTTIVMPQP